MNQAAFIDFLLIANKAGYADPNAKVIDTVDGGHKIVYTQGDVTFSDYWYG